MFDDPLFIRSGRLMEPTSRAQEIFSNLSPALDGIAAALSQCQAFEPATSEATFHIGLCDDVEYALLPQLLRRLRVEAPGTTLVVRRADQWQLSQLLGSGRFPWESARPWNCRPMPGARHCGRFDRCCCAPIRSPVN